VLCCFSARDLAVYERLARIPPTDAA